MARHWFLSSLTLIVGFVLSFLTVGYNKIRWAVSITEIYLVAFC